LRPREPIPRSHWDSGNLDKNFHVGSRGLIETAGSDMKSYAAPAVNNRKYVNKIENFCHISRSLNETAGSVSAVSLRPQDWFPRSHWDHGIRSRGLIETAEYLTKMLMSNPAVSMRPRNPILRSHWYRGIRTLQTIISIFSAKTKPHNFSCRIPRSQWDRGVGFPGLNETAGSASAVSMRPGDRIPRSHWKILCTAGILTKNEYWFSFPLKGNHCKNQYICKHCIHCIHCIETAESDFGDFRIDFLGEYEAICKTCFRPWTRALGGIVWWKKPRVENLVTLSL
jgi:hypothetical protein